MAQNTKKELSLSQWLARWADEYSLDKKYSTVKTYKAQINAHVVPHIGEIQLSELDAEKLNRLYQGLFAGELEEKPLSAKTIRNLHGILHEALAVAWALKLIPCNPTEDRYLIRLPKAVKPSIKPLTSRQIKEFLYETEEDELGGYFKLVLFLGLRESEALGLTWDCVDLESGKVIIEKQLEKRPLADGGYVLSTLKNNKPRHLIMPNFITELLKSEWKQQERIRRAAGSAWEGWNTHAERATAFVFITKNGKHHTQSTVRRHYKKIVQRMGIPNSRVHDLRHTFAVLSLENGDDIKTVQGNLGHASASFTLDVYGHVSDKMKKASAVRMQRFIEQMDDLRITGMEVAV